MPEPDYAAMPEGKPERLLAGWSALWAVQLLLAIAAALGWAAYVQVDIVAKANGRIIPDGREQVITSLEGGILRVMPALSDPTRFDAQQAEGVSSRLAMQGTQARLQAEAHGKALLPGMTGSVEIRIGQRSVLGFLLRPMVRTQEAFKERRTRAWREPG